MDAYIDGTEIRLYPKVIVRKARRGWVELEFEGETYELETGHALALEVQSTVPKQKAEITVNPQVERAAGSCRCACCRG